MGSGWPEGCYLMACCGQAAGRRGVEGPSRLRFFVVPPPEDHVSVEESFSTVYEAKRVLAERPGWRLEHRRISLG